MMGRRRFLTAAIGTVGSLVACSAARLPPVDAVDVRDFGAVGDGVADDSAALQAACDEAAGRRAIFLAERRYLVGDVRMPSGTTILGPGTLVFRPGARHILTVNPGTEGTADPTQNVRNIVLDGIAFEGRSLEGFREYDYQIWLSAVSDVAVRGCRFEAFQGDAIMIGSGEEPGVERHNERISIVGCWFDGVNRENRNAISVIDVRGLEVCRCHFTRCSRPDMPGPIDIEPNPQDRTAVLADIRIVDNVFTDNGGNVANVSLSITPPLLDRPLDGLLIRANTFTGFTRSAVRVAWEGHEAGPADPWTNAVVEGNTASAPGAVAFGELYGLRGLTVRANRVDGVGNTGVMCGFSGVRCVDVTISENVWTDVASRSGSIVTAVRCDRLTVNANRVLGKAPPVLVGLSAGGATSAVTVTDNQLPGGVAVADLGSGHLTTPSLNVAARNGAAPVDGSIFAAPAPG